MAWRNSRNRLSSSDLAQSLLVGNRILDELAVEYEGRVAFAKVDIDVNPMSPGQYGVRGIPTLLVFHDGEEVSRIVGFRPKSDLAAELDKALATE